jgi:Rrf2 family nitric oxide-sensitive transcriptional repressor
MFPGRTTEYALSILTYMATRGHDTYSAEYLYHELRIPRRYLRKLLTELSKLGFLKSGKGRNGGFFFAKELDEISFADIIRSMEGDHITGRCILGFTACVINSPCLMHDIWNEATSRVNEALTVTTLADMKRKYREGPHRDSAKKITQ